jgi:hypothetical protein
MIVCSEPSSPTWGYPPIDLPLSHGRSGTNLSLAFICMFCGHVGHLDEFCFHRKRIEKRRFDYARNPYRDEFIDFLPCTSSHVSSRFFHGPNHHSYDFGLRENSFVPRHFIMAHVLIMVIVPHVGMVFLLEGLTLALSQDIWMVHIFPIVVHVPLAQMERCKRL